MPASQTKHNTFTGSAVNWQNRRCLFRPEGSCSLRWQQRARSPCCRGLAFGRPVQLRPDGGHGPWSERRAPGRVGRHALDLPF